VQLPTLGVDIGSKFDLCPHRISRCFGAPLRNQSRSSYPHWGHITGITQNKRGDSRTCMGSYDMGIQETRPAPCHILCVEIAIPDSDVSLGQD
jgi:hypothetical protein